MFGGKLNKLNAWIEPGCRGLSAAYRKTPLASRSDRARELAQSFLRSRSGNVALLFGITVAVIFGAVGGALDYGRWVNARTQTQNALDAAVLAAGRALQSTGGNADEAIATARSYFDELKPDVLPENSADFSLADDGSAIEGSTEASIETPFLSAVGVKSLPVHTSAKAVAAMGGNAETSLEIGMMLDITGSMSGSKLDNLKLAAKDLINIVVWDNQAEYTSRVAIAPFAPRINVGNYISAMTGLPASKRIDGRTRYPISCVTERTGGYAFTDDAPASGRYLGAYSGNTGNTAINDEDNYSKNGSCSSPSSSEMLLPLTNDKQALNSRIDRLTAGGSTAGQLGTAFAWYLISPNWAHIWPAASRPSPYADLTTIGPNGEPKLRKIAILMSDGIYNTLGGRQYGEASSTAKTISNNSIHICDNMKSAGIIVYTVGFDLGGSQLAIKTLRECASSTEHFYNTATGEQLRQAFRDIALKISRLRLAM